MVDKNVRLKSSNDEGGFDYLYPATKSKIVDVNGKNLDETLNEVTAQLAQKAGKDEVNTMLSNIADGTPNFADSVSEMTDTTKLYVNLSDGFLYVYNAGWINTNVAYQSTGIPTRNVTTDKIAYNSITADRTTFLIESTNIYDHRKAYPGLVDRTNGAILPHNDYHHTDFIEVENDKPYIIKHALRITYYDKDKIFITSHIAPGTGVDEIINTTTPSNAVFSRLTIHNSVVLTTQMNRGDVLFPFETYWVRLKEIEVDGNTITDKSLSVDKLSFLETSTNLYNVKTVKNDTFVDAEGNESTGTGYTTSDFIKIEPNTRYVKSNSDRVIYYDADKKFLSRTGGFNGPFTTIAGAHFIKIVTFNTDPTTVQLNLGDVLLDFEPYYYQIPKELIPSPEEKKKPYYFAPTEDVGVYKNTSDESFTNFPTVASFQAACSTLASSNNSYVTETLVGKDQSGLYDIFQYRLKSDSVPIARTLKNKPKILITCGLHGNEKASIQAMYYFMKELCDGWKDNAVLEYLRHNVEFVIMPLVNPWGYDNTHRYNSNGVDIARNFPYDYASGGPGGDTPLSEAETNAVKTMIDNNSDALFYTDYHTDDANRLFSGFMWFSIGRDELHNENIDIPTQYTIEKMTREFIKRYNQPDDVGYFGNIKYQTSTGYSTKYGSSIGVPSFVTEISGQFPTDSDWQGANILKIHSEIMFNLVITIIRQFKSKY